MRRGSEWGEKEVETAITEERKLCQVWLMNKNGRSYERLKRGKRKTKRVVKISTNKANEY